MVSRVVPSARRMERTEVVKETISHHLISGISWTISSIVLFLLRCRVSDVAEGSEDSGGFGADTAHGPGGTFSG